MHAVCKDCPSRWTGNLACTACKEVLATIPRQEQPNFTLPINPFNKLGTGTKSAGQKSMHWETHAKSNTCTDTNIQLKLGIDGNVCITTE